MQQAPPKDFTRSQTPSECDNKFSLKQFQTAIPNLIFSTSFPPTPLILPNSPKLATIPSSPPPSSRSHRQFAMASARLAPTPLRSLIWLTSRELMIAKRFLVRGVWWWVCGGVIVATSSSSSESAAAITAVTGAAGRDDFCCFVRRMVVRGR